VGPKLLFFSFSWEKRRRVERTNDYCLEMSLPNVVVTPCLEFKDGSHYVGQTLPNSRELVPHGYGTMRTKEGFEMTGFFLNGKGADLCITDPEENLFFGKWVQSTPERGQTQNQRHGRCLSIKRDGKQLIEEYEHGKQLKRTKRREVDGKKDHWLPPATIFGGMPPSARSQHTCSVVMDGGMMVVIGGISQRDCTVLGDVHVADLTEKVWMGTPEMQGSAPPPLYGHTATVVPGDLIVVIGGMLGPLEVSSSVYVLDTLQGVWSEPVTKGINLTGHTATLVTRNGNNTIVVLVQGSVYTLNLHTWSWSEVDDVDKRALGFQNAFVDFSACFYEGMIYCYGGQPLLQAKNVTHEGKVYERMSSDMRVLDVATWTWSVASLTGPDESKSSAKQEPGNFTGMGMAKGGWRCPRAQHSAVIVNHVMYVCGGYTTRNPKMNQVDAAYLGDMQALDLRTGSFLPPSSLISKYQFNVPRGRFTANYYDGRILVLGGANFAFPSMFNDRVFVLGKQPAPEEGRE
jgi:hypothetical protein